MISLVKDLKDPPTILSVSPDETLIAVVSTTSFIIVTITTKSVVTHVSTNAASNPVTALTWGLLFLFLI